MIAENILILIFIYQYYYFVNKKKCLLIEYIDIFRTENHEEMWPSILYFSFF